MNNLRFGVCALPEQVGAAARAGYDYLEMDINALLKLHSEQYRAMASDMEKYGIYPEVLSGILPPGIDIVGGHVSAKEIHEALDHSFEIARALGAETLVFDCPFARRLPLDFDPAMAWRQLGNFIRMLQSYAADNDMRVTLLPMRRSVADLMSYTSEATLISAMLRLDRVGVAASSYNMAMEAESLPALRRCGSLLWHLRTSNVLGNRFPRPGDGEDYASLLAMLKEMSYEGRISCEGGCADFEKDAKEALALLKEAAAK